QSQIDYQSEVILNDAYQKRHPGAQAGEAESRAYAQSHPEEFETYLKYNPQYRAEAQGPGRDEVGRRFGAFKMLAERARREGIDRDKGVRLQLALERRRLLAANYIDGLMKNPEKLVGEAEIAQYFSSHQAEFDEVHARQILVSARPPAAAPSPAPTPSALVEEEARQRALALLRRVRAGEDFARLASETSDDARTREKGGDLGYIGRGQVVAPVEQAAFSLRPGEVSDPVKSKLGFHLVKVEDRRARALESDPAIRQRIISRLQDEKLRRHLDDISARSQIQVAGDFKVLDPR
ncbi:MAG TPA: peptidylprolyl isomerase, partial [Blastocatellia bacterium]|nr:peptidylprolyl isomerase [Blastocatellia bacterium]